MTAALTAGERHVVSIRLTNRCPLHVLPGFRMPDFLLHGGLAGRVKLVGRSRVHLVDEDLFVTTRSIAGEQAVVDIRYRVRNTSTDLRNISVSFVVVGPNGELVSNLAQDQIAVAPGCSYR